MGYYQDFYEFDPHYDDDAELVVVCCKCGKNDLFWEETDDGWRLFEYDEAGESVMHQCDMSHLFNTVKS